MNTMTIPGATTAQPVQPVAPDAGGAVARHTLRVPMRDGIHLATDVYLPAHCPGPLPVLLERTPYGKDEPTRRERTAANPTPLRRPGCCCRCAHCAAPRRLA